MSASSVDTAGRQDPESPVPHSIESILASERLPSLPEVAAKIIEIARDPDPDFDRLIETIKIDPAIAGRILKTANSALLGMRTRASSIEAAVPRLGTTMVRTLVLSFSLADYQSRNSVSLRPWYQLLWRESLTQAATAESLAERQHGKVDPANWFLAGLLQDIGRLALLHICRDEYVQNVLEVEDDRTQRQREQDWLGFTHTEVSAALCRRWNLDSEIVDAIMVHHSPAHRVVPLKFVSSTSLPAALITSAHVSEYMEEVSHNLSCSRETIERLLMQVFAQRPNDVFRLLADVDQRVGELSAAFGIDVGRSPSLESILTDAQELLSQIAIASQLRLVNAHTNIGRIERGRMEIERETEQKHDVQWRDKLTGAFNREWLQSALDSTVEQIHQHKVPFGLLLVDIDQFRTINNLSGEKVGDTLLQQAASVLRHCVRLTDSVTRFGSDEFLVALKDVNQDMLTLIADQIRARVRSDLSATDGPRTITCSIGAVFCEPHEGAKLKADAIIREAEKTLADAKRRGGDHMVLTAFETGKWIPQTVH